MSYFILQCVFLNNIKHFNWCFMFNLQFPPFEVGFQSQITWFLQHKYCCPAKRDPICSEVVVHIAVAAICGL